MKTSKTAAAYIALVLSCVLWGTVYIANRYALTAVTPAELAFIRFFVSAAVLFPALKIRKEPVGFRKEDTKYFVRIAVLGYFLSIELIMMSTKYAGASLSSLINSMSPILITVFAVLILKEKMTDPGSFGNARGARNLFEAAIARQADRLALMTDSITKEALMTLTEADLKAAAGLEPSGENRA